MATLEDELARRAARGDAAATEALMALLWPAVLRYCRARLGRLDGCYATADDVSQEACLAILHALPTYRDMGRPFSAFVYAIAARKVADAHRAAVRSPVSMPIEAMPQRPGTTPGPEQQAVTADLAQRLSYLLRHLPDTHQRIIILRVAVGLTSEEVGQVLGMSATAVRVAQSRALTQLRELATTSLLGV
jgi:RNA polymerase sigma-70 factor (ECF subfamily)